MKKVCFLRSKSPPVLEARICKDALALTKHGLEVTLLLWDREANKPTYEQIDHIKIERLHHRAPYNSPLLVFHLIIWWLKAIHYLLTQEFDVLHACDFDTLPPCLLIKFLRSTKLVYDQFDFYASMIELPIPLFIRSLIARLERRLLNFANQVIIADESRKEQIGKCKKKIWIIANSPPDYSKEFLSKPLEETFTIFYGGILVRTRGLEEAAKLVSSLEKVKLIIAGYGPEEETLVPLFNSTKQVEYIGSISYERIIEQTFKSSLIFALYDPKVPNNKYASPNKLFEAMMARKPIIVSSGSSMAGIVKEEECGIVVDYGDTKALKEAIIRLRDSPTIREKIGASGRKAYLEKYGWDLMEKRLLRIYQSLDK